MEKPINAKQRDHDRKERTKFPKKSIPIAKRAATQCLPRKNARSRHKRDDGRQCRRVEIKRAIEVAAQQGLSRSCSAAKRARKSGCAFKNAYWRTGEPKRRRKRQEGRSNQHGDDEGGGDCARLPLVNSQRWTIRILSKGVLLFFALQGFQNVAGRWIFF